MSHKQAFGAATLIAIVLSLYCEMALSEDAQGASTTDAKVWIGHGQYDMEDFNRAQVSQRNKKLTAGFDAGLELSPFAFKVERDKTTVSLSLPLGLEYLHASTQTTHAIGDNRATVAWNLPVIGIYVAPEIGFSRLAWLTAPRSHAEGAQNHHRFDASQIMVPTVMMAMHIHSSSQNGLFSRSTFSHRRILEPWWMMMNNEMKVAIVSSKKPVTETQAGKQRYHVCRWSPPTGSRSGHRNSRKQLTRQCHLRARRYGWEISETSPWRRHVACTEWRDREQP